MQYSLRLSTILLLVLLLSILSASADITSNLLARWSFDDGSGTSVTDNSGNGHTGTLTGSPVWLASAQVAGGLTCDGVNDRMTYTGIATGGTTWSATVWLRPTGSGDSVQTILLDVATSGGIGLYFRTGDSKVSFFYTGAYHTPTNALTLNQWNHIAVVNNAGSVTFYLNGATNGTATSAPAMTVDNTCDDSFSEHYQGDIDELRLFSRALSGSDVTEAMNFGTVNPPRPRRIIVQ